MGLKLRKILICGEYGNFVARSDGANEKISIRTLNPLCTAEIKELRCRLVIAAGYFKIGKSP